MKNRNKNLLYYIYCALGEKSGKNNKEADTIALIRLFAFLSILFTNSFIVFNAVRTHIIPKEPEPIKCIIVSNSGGLQSVSIV
jgi:hypothetical protein